MFKYILPVLVSFPLLHAEIPKNEQNVIKKVENILRVSSENIWEGFDMASDPLAITFSNGHVFFV